jgi:hypothetical protein
MSLFITDLSRAQYFPRTATEARRTVHWSKMSNEDLLFAHNLLELHQSPYVFEALREICNRTERGEWINPENSPPPLHELPFLLTIWPFNLLHKQGRAQVGEP